MSGKVKNLKNGYKEKIFLNEKLSKYNWFNLGGSAEIFFRPDNIDQLKDFYQSLDESKKKN